MTILVTIRKYQPKNKLNYFTPLNVRARGVPLERFLILFFFYPRNVPNGTKFVIECPVRDISWVDQIFNNRIYVP